MTCAEVISARLLQIFKLFANLLRARNIGAQEGAGRGNGPDAQTQCSRCKDTVIGQPNNLFLLQQFFFNRLLSTFVKGFITTQFDDHLRIYE